MKPFSEIARCVCGGGAYCHGWEGAFLIACERHGTREVCWTGPLRKTERAAINAWNKIMEKGK